MCGEIVGGVEGGFGWRVEGEFGGVIGDGVFGVVGSGGGDFRGCRVIGSLVSGLGLVVSLDVARVKSVMVVRGVVVVVLELVGFGVEADVV